MSLSESTHALLSHIEAAQEADVKTTVLLVSGALVTGRVWRTRDGLVAVVDDYDREHLIAPEQLAGLGFAADGAAALDATPSGWASSRA